MKEIRKLEKRAQTTLAPQTDGTMAEVPVYKYYEVEDLANKINELVDAFNELNRTTRKIIFEDKQENQEKIIDRIFKKFESRFDDKKHLIEVVNKFDNYEDYYNWEKAEYADIVNKDIIIFEALSKSDFEKLKKYLNKGE